MYTAVQTFNPPLPSNPFMVSFFRDLRQSLRMFAASPAFTLAAIAALTLGIGANTAIFSVVNAILLRAPEGTAPERLVDIYSAGPESGAFFTGFWVVERLREDGGDVLDGVAAWVPMRAAVDDDGTPRPVLYELVTGRPPFSGGSALEVLHQHLSAEPRRPSTVPDPLWTVIERCLKLDLSWDTVATRFNELVTPLVHK